MLSSNTYATADRPSNAPRTGEDEAIDVNLIQNAQAYLECLSRGCTPGVQWVNAWQRFYRLASGLIHRFARACGIPEHQLDDCRQEVWLELLKALRSFRYDPARARFPTWLFTLVRSKGIDLIRKSSKRASQSLDGQENTWPGREDADPADHCERKDQQQAVRSLFGVLRLHLSPQTYDVFFLRSIKALEVAEVAKSLGLTPAQVRLHHHRAKQKFRNLFSHHRQQKQAALESWNEDGLLEFQCG